MRKVVYITSNFKEKIYEYPNTLKRSESKNKRKKCPICRCKSTYLNNVNVVILRKYTIIGYICHFCKSVFIFKEYNVFRCFVE